MEKVSFYIGFAMQIAGFAAVGLCLFTGMNNGDYGKLELIQFLGGAFVFYLGHFIRSRGGFSA